MVARGGATGILVNTWRRVQIPMEAGLLGFSCDMPWSTSVLLVSSSKGLMWIDLKGEWHGLLKKDLAAR